MMKIVQINSVCGVGSTGRIVVDISQKLNEFQIENYIFYGVGSSDYPQSIKIGGDWNVRTHQLATRLLGKHGFASKQATKYLIHRLTEIKPDLIHLHNLHGFYLNIELLFKYLEHSSTKVVWTLHDCWSYTGHCAYYDFVNCSRWKTQCFNCPALNEYPVSYFFDRSTESFIKKKHLFNLRKQLILVTPSKWLAGELAQSFLQSYPVKIINNGINLQEFKPLGENFKVCQQLENKFLILGVASIWERRKGLDYFIELAKQLNDDEVIVLVGLTNAQKAMLPQGIIGLEKTNSTHALAEIYSAADVFVNPTLEDNFPTTNLEALACGTPVITFNTGGSPEAISEGTGYVVDKGDFSSLREKIDLVKQQGKNAYSENCVARAKALYNKEAKYAEYLELYRELISK